MFEEGMSVPKQIKILCLKLGISAAELGRLDGKSPQSFSQKMRRASFTVDEMKTLAEEAGCRYETAFVLPDGDRVKY